MVCTYRVLKYASYLVHTNELWDLDGRAPFRGECRVCCQWKKRLWIKLNVPSSITRKRINIHFQTQHCNIINIYMKFLGLDLNERRQVLKDRNEGRVILICSAKSCWRGSIRGYRPSFAWHSTRSALYLSAFWALPRAPWGGLGFKATFMISALLRPQFSARVKTFSSV